MNRLADYTFDSKSVRRGRAWQLRPGRPGGIAIDCGTMRVNSDGLTLSGTGCLTYVLAA